MAGNQPQTYLQILEEFHRQRAAQAAADNIAASTSTQPATEGQSVAGVNTTDAQQPQSDAGTDSHHGQFDADTDTQHQSEASPAPWQYAPAASEVTSSSLKEGSETPHAGSPVSMATTINAAHWATAPEFIRGHHTFPPADTDETLSNQASTAASSVDTHPPNVVQNPVIQNPVIQNPVAPAPAAQIPVVQGPILQALVVQPPIVHDPAIQDPMDRILSILNQHTNALNILNQNAIISRQNSQQVVEFGQHVTTLLMTTNDERVTRFETSVQASGQAQDERIHQLRNMMQVLTDRMQQLRELSEQLEGRIQVGSTPQVDGTVLSKLIAKPPHYVSATPEPDFQQLCHSLVSVANQQVKFTKDFLLSFFDAKEYSPSFYLAKKNKPFFEGDYTIVRRAVHPAEALHSHPVAGPSSPRQIRLHYAMYVFDHETNPYLPMEAGKHGAAISPFIRELDDDMKQAEKLYDNVPLFVHLPNSFDADGKKLYAYLGNYSQTRWSDQLDVNRAEDEIVDHVKRHWAEVLTSPSRPQWLTNKLVDHLYPKPEYTGKLPPCKPEEVDDYFTKAFDPRNRVSQEFVKDMSNFFGLMFDREEDKQEVLDDLTIEGVLKLFSEPDAAMPPGLRFFYEYLICVGFERYFYYALASANQHGTVTGGEPSNQGGPSASGSAHRQNGEVSTTSSVGSLL